MFHIETTHALLCFVGVYTCNASRPLLTPLHCVGILQHKIGGVKSSGLMGGPWVFQKSYLMDMDMHSVTLVLGTRE